MANGMLRSAQNDPRGQEVGSAAPDHWLRLRVCAAILVISMLGDDVSDFVGIVVVVIFQKLGSTIFEQQDKKLVEVTGGLFPDPVAPGALSF